MYDFTKIAADELSGLIHGNEKFEIEIPGSVTKFKQHIPDVDFSQPQEVPPSPVIISAEAIAHALLLNGGTMEGRFTQLVIFIYALGGKILYTETQAGNYKAAVTWPK